MLEDILKFQLKRVNPFQGLVIDADTWRDAHNYHRDLMRLHLLALHQAGIVEGLGVSASTPPDLSVVIQPGLGIDPEGNIIIVAQPQRYRLQTRDKSTVYLVIQFREVLTEPYQPPEGGQPTRIVDAYRIQERDTLPSEPYLELARIDFDPADKAIRDATSPSNPARNEVNLCCRRELLLKAPAAVPERTAPQVVAASSQTITIGRVSLGGQADLHSAGLRNLVREVNLQDRLAVNLEDSISLDKSINRCALVYLTGKGRFELTAEQQAALGGFLKSGGVVFGEGCGEGGEAKAFGLAFNQLATQLKCKLEVVQRGHPLLSAVHIFSEVPPGSEPGMLLDGGRMVYSGSDYGCAWQGGRKDSALPRDLIRTSFEIGANIVVYAQSKSGR